MFCYWGAQVREGFGLLQAEVKHDKSEIRSVCPNSKSAVQDISAGRSFVGFIRDGKVSVMRLRGENCDQDGKLSIGFFIHKVDIISLYNSLISLESFIFIYSLFNLIVAYMSYL